MAETDDENKFGGFFYSFDYMARLDLLIEQEADKLKSLKKQRKDAEKQLMRQGLELVEEVKSRGSLAGQVTIDDFMGQHTLEAKVEE